MEDSGKWGVREEENPNVNVLWISEDKELTEDLRREILSGSEKMISGLIKNQKEYIQYNHRTEEAVDSMEPTIKTPEIRVVLTKETLRNQKSSDFIVLAGNQETNFEVQEETRQKSVPQSI